MSRRNKLLKFAELLSFPNVIENPSAKNPELIGKDGAKVDLKGRWKEKHFGNDHPLTLELACGRGEYTIELARAYPDRNFIGVDIKGARIWKGATIALEEKLINAAFLRTRIELIAHFFEKGEVDEIWITFPDPFVKEKKSNRRLTSPIFLPQYQKILKTGGLVHLKTDDDTLYDYSLETITDCAYTDILYQNDDIYSSDLVIPELAYKTRYENMHLEIGKKIKYIQFNIN